MIELLISAGMPSVVAGVVGWILKRALCRIESEQVRQRHALILICEGKRMEALKILALNPPPSADAA